MATNETKIPSIPPIPSDVAPNLKTYLSAVDEALKVRLGRTGDPKDRAVTVRELIDTGLAENFLENPFNPDAGTPDNTFIPTERVDVTIPPDVTGFSGTGAFQKIILQWDLAQFGNFAFTEIWRHTSNDIGSATRIDTTRAQVYADTVDLDANFYYWVRHVSTSNIVGQFTNGINVTTSKVSSSNVTNFFTADSITAASGVIADATIGTAEIANSAITTAKIDNAAITNAKIDNAAITSAKLGSAAVETLKIADQAVFVEEVAVLASDINLQEVGPSGSYTTILTKSITLSNTTSNSSIIINGLLEAEEICNKFRILRVRIRRGSTVLAEYESNIFGGVFFQGIAPFNIFPVFLVDTANDGTTTYTLEAKDASTPGTPTSGNTIKIHLGTTTFSLGGAKR